MKKTLLALALISANPAHALDERPSGSAEQTALAVTIYNGDLALVKDARKVRVDNGDNLLAWRDVSAQMQPETALLRSTEGKKLTLLEQNFDFDLLTPQKLLEKSVGETVRVLRTQPITGVEFSEYATLLAANEGTVLQFKDRVETGIPGRLGFNAVPGALRDRPTLSMLFNTEIPTSAGHPGANSAADMGLELSYLTAGLTWKADYVAELSAKEDSIDLNGWVTLTNTSGTTYPKARLQLVAGEVNRAQPERGRMPVMMKAMAMADAAPQMREENLFEYHLYTLDRLTTLLDKQTKQVALLSAQNVKTDKEFRFQGADWYYGSQQGDLGRKLKPGVYMEFSNKGGNLGVPLPKGIVRVYKKDSAGRAQFIGEDRIDHTAKGETIKLKLGDAFDITADKKQSDFQKISAGFNNRGGVIETAYVMEIRNAKNEKVTVTVIEPMHGDWQILQESLAHKKEAAHTAVWVVPIPAEGKTTLTWRVRAKF
ncbi:MAG: DUF4139 domain-containing protein [Hydrogenophilales bacterium 28-61-23]|nr:MAG: DUF4139 domain-containing protein [Hydrogenophilales bacterium 28-61-23]